MTCLSSETVIYCRKTTKEGTRMMKKLLIALLAVCILFAGFLTWKNYTPRNTAAQLTAEAVQPLKSVDFDALYATHAPDEVVMKIDGKEVTWGDYFYIYHYSASSSEQMFAYYGMETDWDMVLDEEKKLTLAGSVADETEQQLRDFCAIETLAERSGILAEDLQPQAEEILKSFADSYAASSGGNEEAIFAMLQEQYMDRNTYLTFIVRNLTENELFAKLYGENAGLVSDEDAQKYIDDNEYAKFNHILFLCMDMTTGTPLDESVQAQKLAQAQDVAQELRAQENTEARLELFAKYKDELDEDTGKTAYPDGYICTPDASFVPEFLDGGYALADYEVSEPVKSAYGYHVMLRQPVGPDEVLDERSGATARMIVAQEDYNSALAECADGMNSEYVNGFTPPVISEFVR